MRPRLHRARHRMRLFVVAMLFLITPSFVRAESSSSSLQALIQAGSVGEMGDGLTGPAAALDWMWAPSLIGWWGEFGVLEKPGIKPHAATGQSNDHGTRQVMEISTGFIARVPGRDMYPYFRAGVGAYRDDIMQPFNPKLLDVPWTTDGPSAFALQEWGFGISLGVGLRLGLRAPLPAPTIEARLHITRFDGAPNRSLLALTGGFWFR